MRIHESAIVDDGAQIGDGTVVWHHSHVRASAIIGSGCVLGKNVYIDADVVVGARCKIQNNVSIYRGVRLEDDVFVGPSVVFTNDLRPRASSTDWPVVPTAVHRGASIGANATILCGVEIGEYSLVAAGSVVTHDVRPHEVVRGNPARPAGWICRCGSRVTAGEGFDEGQCDCGVTD